MISNADVGDLTQTAVVRGQSVSLIANLDEFTVVYKYIQSSVI